MPFRLLQADKAVPPNTTIASLGAADVLTGLSSAPAARPASASTSTTTGEHGDLHIRSVPCGGATKQVRNTANDGFYVARRELAVRGLICLLPCGVTRPGRQPGR